MRCCPQFVLRSLDVDDNGTKQHDGRSMGMEFRTVCRSRRCSILPITLVVVTT